MMLSLLPAASGGAVVREFEWEFAPSSYAVERDRNRLEDGQYLSYAFEVTDATARLEYEIEAPDAVDVFLMSDADFDAFENDEEFSYYIEGSDISTTHSIERVDATALPNGRTHIVIDYTDTATRPAFEWQEVDFALKVVYRFAFQAELAEEDIRAYEHVSLDERLEFGALVTTLDPTLIALAEYLRTESEAAGLEDVDVLSNVLAFTQSLPYTPDTVTTGFDEYPRFPIETLAEYGGDCEDTSILYATLVSLLEYGVVLLSPPGHMAVGVLGEDLEGTYFAFDGGRYYFAETTGEGFGIGELPAEYVGEKSEIFEITGEQYLPEPAQPSPSPVPTPSPAREPIPMSAKPPTAIASSSPVPIASSAPVTPPAPSGLVPAAGVEANATPWPSAISCLLVVCVLAGLWKR
jgi:hypothetical protein